jgi:hypothetical protein
MAGWFKKPARFFYFWRELAEGFSLFEIAGGWRFHLYRGGRLSVVLSTNHMRGVDGLTTGCQKAA